MYSTVHTVQAMSLHNLNRYRTCTVQARSMHNYRTCTIHHITVQEKVHYGIQYSTAQHTEQ